MTKPHHVKVYLYFILPLSMTEKRPFNKQKANHPFCLAVKISPENFNILVVDDEKSLRDIFSMYLELDGYNVFTAQSGNQALDVLSHNQIHFVITDVKMPDGDGVMLLKEIRKTDDNLPVIILISGFSTIKKEEFVAMGAIDLLPKPTNLKTITKHIKEAMMKF